VLINVEYPYRGKDFALEGNKHCRIHARKKHKDQAG
jgi:hypothetical protein